MVQMYSLVLRKPHSDRHVLLTTYSLVDWHYPTRELHRIPRSLDSCNIEILKGFKIHNSNSEWPDIITL